MLERVIKGSQMLTRIDMIKGRATRALREIIVVSRHSVVSGPEHPFPLPFSKVFFSLRIYIRRWVHSLSFPVLMCLCFCFRGYYVHKFSSFGGMHDL